MVVDSSAVVAILEEEPGSDELLRRLVESGVRFFASKTCHHVPEVYSAVGENEAAALLREFFKARR